MKQMCLICVLKELTHSGVMELQLILAKVSNYTSGNGFRKDAFEN